MGLRAITTVRPEAMATTANNKKKACSIEAAFQVMRILSPGVVACNAKEAHFRGNLPHVCSMSRKPTQRLGRKRLQNQTNAPVREKCPAR